MGKTENETRKQNPQTEDKTALFATMPVGKALWTMAIPTIVSQLITMIYNLADTFFIGMTNDPYKVAAASVVTVLFFILTSLANLFGVGGGSLMSRLMGEKRDEVARHVGVFSIYGSLAIAVVYSLLCLMFTEPLARLLGASDNTIGYASSYLFWAVVIGAVPSTLGMTMSFLIRSAGYSRESGLGLAIGGIANIILDPLFMFVLLPGGNEVTGAAMATMLSNVITLVYFLFVYLRLRGKSILSLSPKYIHIEKSLVVNILAIGLPSALTAMLANITSIIKNNLTSGYGDIELAAYGIVMKADMLPLNIGMGLCQGMMPLVAYNYAAKNYQRMKSFTKAAQTSGIIIAGVCILVFELFAPQIMWLFIKDEATIAYGTNFLRIACLATPFMISNFQKIYCLQAMGKGKESLVLGVLRQGLFAIPVIYVMNHFLQLYGIVSAQLISDGITIIFATLIYRHVYHKLEKEIAVNKAATQTDDVVLKPSKKGVIITIAREHGSSGKQIGKLVAERLGIPFYYKEMTALAAQESGLHKEFISDINMNSPKTLHSLYLSTEVVQQAIVAQNNIIRKIADHGSCVIVGRAADYVLRDYENVVRIFICAPEAYKIQRVMEVYGDRAEDAKKNVRKSDTARASYYKNISGRIWGDRKNYELIVDSSVGVAETAETICTYLKSRV